MTTCVNVVINQPVPSAPGHSGGLPGVYFPSSIGAPNGHSKKVNPTAITMTTSHQNSPTSLSLDDRKKINLCRLLFGGLVHWAVDANVGFLAISNRTAPRKFKAANVSNATV